MNIPAPTNSDAGVQADIPEPEVEENTLKIRPFERIKLYPKVPPEPSSYGKGKGYSRPWILQDGREPPAKGSEMRAQYTTPKRPPHTTGIRKRLLTDFFWEQMLDEVIDELASSQPVTEYCTEYEANYIKENFEPRNMEISLDKDKHLKYPLYGTGSSAITFYSEVIHKVGPMTPPNGSVRRPDERIGMEAYHLSVFDVCTTIEQLDKHEILEKFRRTQDFTKPMGERLDNGWVL